MSKTIKDVLTENLVPTMNQIGKAEVECTQCKEKLDVFTMQCGPDGPLCHDCVDWNNYRKEGVMKAKKKENLK